jgi:hypothetical protein
LRTARAATGAPSEVALHAIECRELPFGDFDVHFDTVPQGTSSDALDFALRLHNALAQAESERESAMCNGVAIITANGLPLYTKATAVSAATASSAESTMPGCQRQLVNISLAL